MKETGVSIVLLKPMLRYQTNTKHHEFINNSNPTTAAVYIKQSHHHTTLLPFNKPTPHHPLTI